MQEAERRRGQKEVNTWVVSPMWKGKTVAILASGPSMSQELADKVRQLHLPTIAINTTFRLAPWADVFYAADAVWWERYLGEVQKFGGLRVSCGPDVVTGVMQLKNTGKVGFDTDPGCIRTGGNSGYQAIHLATHAGAAQILLFGYDMRGGHWHSRHPDPLRNAGEGIYERWLVQFQVLAPLLRERGVKVINCTPGSALRVWPPIDQEDLDFLLSQDEESNELQRHS